MKPVNQELEGPEGNDYESHFPSDDPETVSDNATNETRHTIECLRDGDASACPKCKPINDQFRNQWEEMTPTEKDYYIGIIPE